MLSSYHVFRILNVERTMYLSINIQQIIYWAPAAKLLQSRPTLCDPIDSSPPGSPVPGILQARTLEWVAISFSKLWKLGLFLMGRAIILKSLIQLSADGWGCVPFLFDLWWNYGGGNEDNGDLLPKVLCKHCQLSTLTLQQATTDPHHCQRLLDTHG